MLQKLSSKVLAILMTLLLELAALLSLPFIKNFAPAKADGTAELAATEQSLIRAQTLAQSYYQQFFNSPINRLSFYPNSFRTASCWEYIGLLSLTYKLALTDKDQIDKLGDVMDGLLHYRRQNTGGSFAGYAVNWNIRKNAPASEDIAYDDNMWLGRDFVGLYELTGEKRYLDLAVEVADWLIAEAYVDLPQSLFEAKGLPLASGAVGGFYWSYGKDALHVCSNGPAAQFLAALYRVSGEETYLAHAKAAYNFLPYLENNQGVFSDLMTFQKDAQNNILAINGPAGPPYSYNSGSPITAAAELYRITQEERYLQDAKHWAACADAYFAQPSAADGVLQYPDGDAKVWFNLILLNGYLALAPYAPETMDYIEHMRTSINYAYENYRSQGTRGVYANILPTNWVNGFPEDKYQPVALDVSAAAEIYLNFYLAYQL